MNRKATILVVDDEDIIRNILVKLIHAMGYRVLQASNSTEAMTMLRQHKPDLALLDMIMPGVDSLEVLNTVRSDNQLKDTAIILISAVDDLDAVAAYIEAGADDFLPKPFNGVLLKLKIRNALDRKFYRLRLQAALQCREEFCRQLSHDLNNSLTGIIMSAELLLMEHDSGQSKQHLEDIIASSEQVSTLIKQRRRTIGEQDSDLKR